MFVVDGTRLVYHYDDETVWVEPWGANALRIRATKQAQMPTEDWALDQAPTNTAAPVISICETSAHISNEKIHASIGSRGKLVITNSAGKTLLEEYQRNRKNLQDPKCSALSVEAREFKPHLGTTDWHLTYRLESQDRHEKIYGMGQYQQPFLDLKGLDLELAQRNSQASVPFAVSSLGYGLLWNNPAVGRAVLGKNIMSFEALSTKALDYWIVAGDSPAEIVEAYAAVTGTPPMMPEYGLGFWQSKLRYQTQEELLEVAREHRRRNLPLDVIVVDFFHWAKQGEWKFDPTYWPDPVAMVEELKELNVELMVSIWPTVDKTCENYPEMLQKGYIIRSDKGLRTAYEITGQPPYVDFTNPAAGAYLWDKIKKNYYDKGIKIFWLDEAEPQYTIYDFDIWRYWKGPVLQIGNIYPRDYARAFYNGMRQSGQTHIVNLARCAWAGSQKYGALVWSGDIACSWQSLRCQLAAGLNMGLAGIPWWSTDIGGFHGGDPTDEAFRELFVRWFQWATFCPVMRMHGDRVPKQPQQGDTGGAWMLSGAPNEVWSYGEEVYEICKKYLEIRESLRDYTRHVMKAAHERGTPVIRPLLYDFPADEMAWEVEDQYMFGSKLLVAPILHAGVKSRSVYLPHGVKWKTFEGQDSVGYDGGQKIVVDCHMDSMPVFLKQ
ncbi:putative glycosyl hydrolase [Phyllosticta citriasiana]|uniref:Glycosyl hydrolase n=1 Tax=Phyllosticta citriasiana TaxID=595635 RepID=A0ABR1KG33_9PEZI